MSCHYVYVITDTESGQFYIGCRETYHDSPERDRAYRGSGCWAVRAKVEGRTVTKKIAGIFDDHLEARRLEFRLIRKGRRSPLCMNLDGRVAVRRSMRNLPLAKWPNELAKRSVPVRDRGSGYMWSRPRPHRVAST